MQETAQTKNLVGSEGHTWQKKCGDVHNRHGTEFTEMQFLLLQNSGKKWRYIIARVIQKVKTVWFNL
jgi:hypothetical protein